MPRPISICSLALAGAALAGGAASAQVAVTPSGGAQAAQGKKFALQYYDVNRAATPFPDTINWQAQLVAQGSPADDLGAQLTPADDSLRALLKLPEGRGLVVTGVAEGGRAARAGLKGNDILLTLDDKPLAQPGDLEAQLYYALNLAAIGEGAKTATQQPVELKILRDGKPLSLQVRPDVRVALGSAAEEKPNYYIGTPANPLDETLRAHLVDIAEGTGLIVGEIEPTSPAGKGGVQKNDILVLFDDEPLPDVEALRSKIQAKGPKPAKIRVYRAGRSVDLVVTPEPRKPEATATRWLGDATSPTLLQYYNGLYRVNPGAPVLSEAPFLNKLIVTDADQDGRPDLYAANQDQPAAPDLAKKIDALSEQVKALSKAVEDLRKQAAEKK